MQEIQAMPIEAYHQPSLDILLSVAVQVVRHQEEQTILRLQSKAVLAVLVVEVRLNTIRHQLSNWESKVIMAAMEMPPLTHLGQALVVAVVLVVQAATVRHLLAALAATVLTSLVGLRAQSIMHQQVVVALQAVLAARLATVAWQAKVHLPTAIMVLTTAQVVAVVVVE